MAAAAVQSAKSYFSGAASATLAFPSNVTAGNLLIACMHAYDANTGADNFTDSLGNTYTNYITATNGGLALTLWYCANCLGGACTVTCTPGSSTSYVSFTIAEFSGIATTSPTDGFDTNTGTSTAPSGGPITPTQSGDLLVGIMVDDGGSNQGITPDADYTQLQEYEDGVNYLRASLLYRIYNSTSADTVNWTLGTSKSWIGGIAAFKAAAAVTKSDVPPNIIRKNYHLFVR